MLLFTCIKQKRISDKNSWIRIQENRTRKIDFCLLIQYLPFPKMSWIHPQLFDWFCKERERETCSYTCRMNERATTNRPTPSPSRRVMKLSVCLSVSITMIVSIDAPARVLWHFVHVVSFHLFSTLTHSSVSVSCCHAGLASARSVGVSLCRPILVGGWIIVHLRAVQVKVAMSAHTAAC